MEIPQTYRGMMVAIAAEQWPVFAKLSAAKLAEVLQEIARQVSLQRYRKTPRGPKKPQPKRKRYRNGEHVSTAKLIAERRGR